MRKSLLLVLIIVLLLCSGITLKGELSTLRGDTRVMSQDAKRRASAVADRFLIRFRETLDFGTVFDEMGSSNALLGLRSTKFFEGFQFDPDLLHRTDDASLGRAYKAMMNVYYLGMLYSISKCTGEQEPKIPEDIEAALKASKFSDATIKTAQEMEEYISLNNQLAALYKKHLSRDVFESAAYGKKFARIEKQREKDHVAFNNYEDFGVPKGYPVYLAQRDFFSIALVEEAGEMKVIRLGIGN